MPYETLAPSIRVIVSGVELDVEVTRYITRCVCEQTQEMADKITLSVINARTDVLGSGYDGTFIFTDSKVFLPGNTILVYMGYSGDEKLVGAGIIQKYLPVFPKDGAATLTIEAYDGSVLLMDGELAQDGMSWEDTPHSEVVMSVANTAAILIGTLEPTASERQTLKKRGMSDWELVAGLANLHGFYTKVRWNEDVNNWELHWGPDIFGQEKQYTFTYSINGQDNTLLEFSPEMAMKDQPTTVKLLYFDKDTRTWEEVKLEETKSGEDPVFKGPAELESEITSSTQYRLAAGQIAIDVIPGVHFDTAEDAQYYAEKWFQARKDQFITARGVTIGLEVLSAGHVHVVEGVGTALSGEYQFTTVRHVYDKDDGYTCEFFAHKVLT